jgi:hypothetical protein
MWAVRARHALAAAGWIVLPLASLAGHWMVPPAVGGKGEPVADRRTVDQFEGLAYGLESLREEPAPAGARAAPPELPSLWSQPMAARLFAGDSVDIASADPALLTVGGGRRPVWLVARALPGGRLVLAALADDRTGPAGEALFYHPEDSVPVPLATPLLELGDGGVHAQAPAYRVASADQPGVALDSWPRRILLAWALQAPELLGPLAPGARVDWALSPGARLAQLTPFVSWGEPVARIVDGELLWIVDGYVPPAAFPLATRLDWRGRQVAGLRAALLGTVSAQTGASHVYLRPGADALASAWATIAEGVIEPAAAIPDAVWRVAPYPVELFRMQARLLERSARKLGTPGGRTGAGAAEPPKADAGWSADTTGPVLTVAFERAGERRVNALLVGSHEEGSDALRLFRLDSATVLPSRSALESRWARFPSYDALSDSIREEGGRLERGPVRFDLAPQGLVAYQSHFAGLPGGQPSLVWVTVAAGERQGAGHSLREAWSNLLGASVPAIAGQGQSSRLEEARRLLQRADSALRASDWDAFGRAWTDLRRTLGLPFDSSAP